MPVTTAWVIVGLVALIVWLTIEFAPQALEASKNGGQEREIEVFWGWVTILLVSSAALLIGWNPVFEREGNDVRGRSITIGFVIAGVVSIYFFPKDVTSLFWFVVNPTVAEILGLTLGYAMLAALLILPLIALDEWIRWRSFIDLDLIGPDWFKAALFTGVIITLTTPELALLVYPELEITDVAYALITAFVVTAIVVLSLNILSELILEWIPYERYDAYERILFSVLIIGGIAAFCASTWMIYSSGFYHPGIDGTPARAYQIGHRLVDSGFFQIFAFSLVVAIASQWPFKAIYYLNANLTDVYLWGLEGPIRIAIVFVALTGFLILPYEGAIQSILISPDLSGTTQSLASISNWILGDIPQNIAANILISVFVTWFFFICAIWVLALVEALGSDIYIDLPAFAWMPIVLISIMTVIGVISRLDIAAAIIEWSPTFEGFAQQNLMSLYLAGGGLVIAAVVAFVAASLMIRILDLDDDDQPRSSISWIIRVLKLAPSYFLSMCDWVLTRQVAWVIGVTHRNPVARYLQLIFVLLALFSFSYLMPPPWGIAGVAVGMLVILSVIRRWSWVEKDRAEFVVRSGKNYQDSVRIGFGQDLRDEALTVLLALFVFIPLGLQQADLAFDWYEFEGSANPALIDWIGFFGAELAKAVPLVDWSEVFNVHNGSPIHPKEAEGAGAIFALRVTLDLILLNAVVQAAQISGRLSEQKNAFFNGPLTILEPFEEHQQFRSLVFDNGRRVNRFKINSFQKYENARLHELIVGLAKPESGKDRSDQFQPILKDAAARAAAVHIAAGKPAEEVGDGFPFPSEFLFHILEPDSPCPPIMRSSAAWCLSNDTSDRAINTLTSYIEADRVDQAVRIVDRDREYQAITSAIFALDRIGDPRAVGSLSRLLLKRTRQIAEEHERRSDRQFTRPAFSSNLLNNQIGFLAVAIGRLGQSSATPDLAEALDRLPGPARPTRPTPLTNLRIAAALARLGSDRGQRLLKEEIVKMRGRFDRLRSGLIAEGLIFLHDTDAVKDLKDAAEASRDSETQDTFEIAVAALEGGPPTAAIRALDARFYSLATKRLAIIALGELAPTEQSISKLQSMAQDENASWQLALEADIALRKLSVRPSDRP